MNTTRAAWVDGLSALSACDEAVRWASGYESLDAAWGACDRGDWMLWLLGRVSGAPESEARKALVLCACACARTALPYTNDERVLACIETAERWTRGEASIKEVRAGRRGASAAAAADAADAAYAAADAAAAAYAADAAYAAAAAYAADAAYAAADADARTAALKACADIVRQHYPTAPQIGGAR